MPLSRFVLHLLSAWGRVAAVTDAAVQPEMTAELFLLLGGRRARQEHAQDRDVLVVVLRALDPLAADRFRLQPQPGVEVRRQDIHGHCVFFLLFERWLST